MSAGRVGGERERGVDTALEAIDVLAGQIGPRAPTSEQEAAAARWLAERLEQLGLETEIEGFPAYRSFGLFYIPLFVLALASGWFKRLGAKVALGGLAAAIGFWEGEFRSWGSLGRLWPGSSQNVCAVIDSAGQAERTVCLVCHLDSSRSGMMFSPVLAPYLGKILAGVSGAVGVQAAAHLLTRLPTRLGLWGSKLSRGVIAAALALVVERELRGEDVAGANDNASGVGACLALAEQLAAAPLSQTRVVVLATGGEEAGVLGMRHFLASRDTRDWLFLNFDGVGADASLRYLRVEGGPLSPRRADEEMVRLAERIGAELPELGLSACDHGSGLPYDATAVLARGGRALTLVCQGRSIPNYHWPSDLPTEIEPASLGRAIRLAQEMLVGIDRGEADRAG